jgi:hypothetical protein
LLPITLYFWQVRARNAAGLTHADQGTWASFTTGSDWSTNFAAVSDPAAAGIFSPENTVSLDTSNVLSGGKSVKISGTIGQANSLLNLNFGTWGLINQASFDLSGKTIHYEIYLPADSPVDKFNFYMFGGGNYVLIASPAAVTPTGAWHTYSLDISAVIASKSWVTASPGLSESDVVNLLKNVQIIGIQGGVSTDHPPAVSYFLIDRLGWEASTP